METREIDRRTTSGVDVALYWSPEDDTLTLVVEDAASGERFECPVDRDDALDAFNHPYAYAAFRGLGLGATLEPLRL
jgi:hypothetical protein